VDRYAGWLATCDVPKLFVNAEAGRLLIGRLRETCRRWPNQREVTVRVVHCVQEDSPNEIARAIGEFLTTLPEMRDRTLDEGVYRTARS
jgi:haloalkane dehalogenase